MTLINLPTELLYLIGNALPTPSLLALTRTSKYLHARLSQELTNRTHMPGNDHISAIYHAILIPSPALLTSLLSRTPHRIHGYKYPANHTADVNVQDLVSYVLRKGAGTDIVGNAALYFSVTRGKLRLTRQLLKGGADPCLRERCDVSALHLAAMEGDVQMLQMMLGECGINVGIEDVYGRTAVYTAITSRKVQSVRVLLDAGEDINRRTYVHSGRTVLSFAVSRGETEIVKLLLERGADVKRLDRGGRSALGIAVANGDVEIVRMLLKAGAKVSDGTSGPLAEAPLTVAQRLEDPTIHHMLIESGGKADGDVENN